MKVVKLRKKYMVSAFSLIEMAMVLLVMGIIAGAMFKGRDVIETAQIRAVVSDIESLRIAYATYASTYSALPGDDGAASSRFSGVENGDGNGAYSESDAGRFFSHLHGAGLIGDPKFKVPKVGGQYIPIADNGALKIKISDKDTAVLSKKQVIQLQAKIMESIGKNVIETEPAIDKGQDSDAYIIKIAIN